MMTYTIALEMTDDQFYEFCQKNSDLKFERNAKGEIIIMPPTGGETGSSNATLTARFVMWNEQENQGVVFDSSTGFRLPNGATRSPDVAWVQREIWDALSPEGRMKFPSIAPDFVLELMSPTDTLQATQAKMREYMENGVRLGWLFDRKTHRIEIYRSNQPVETLEAPETLSGEDVLSGFSLNLSTIW